MLTFEQIQEIIAAVAEHGIESVEIERSGFRLSVVGRSAPTVVAGAPVTGGLPAIAPAAGASTAVVAATGEAPPLAESVSVEEVEGHVLSSPIVGTFYSAPNPESEPYARIGDRVKKGQILCIVEAMKLMNEIESDCRRGRLSRSSARTLRRSSSASRSSPSIARPEAASLGRTRGPPKVHVQEDPDRQPWRDRAARHPGLP